MDMISKIILIFLSYSVFQPEIPTLEQYFSHFDGKKFVMLDWLKELYPDDWERNGDGMHRPRRITLMGCEGVEDVVMWISTRHFERSSSSCCALEYPDVI